MLHYFQALQATLFLETKRVHSMKQNQNMSVPQSSSKIAFLKLMSSGNYHQCQLKS